ncbi:CaiB/BaiF CoA transferase family protein [Siccirubricoccus deserti]
MKDRLGIDFEALSAINPRIVLGSISGFGQTGPYARRPGFDQIAQGMGGLMSVTGLPGQGPVRVGIPVADLTAGLYTALGIMVALLEREQTGRGRWVHTSLLEAMVGMMDFQATRWTMKHEVPKQAGNDHPTTVPTGLFRTRDGLMNLAGGGQEMWNRIVETLGIQEQAKDPAFATDKTRAQNREKTNALLQSVLETDTSENWIARLNKAGVPSGPVYAMDEVFADPQVQHLGLEWAVPHPTLGEVKLVRAPMNIEGVAPAPADAGAGRAHRGGAGGVRRLGRGTGGAEGQGSGVGEPREAASRHCGHPVVPRRATEAATGFIWRFRPEQHFHAECFQAA